MSLPELLAVGVWVIIAGLLAVVVAWFVVAPVRVRVQGESMAPGLVSGTRVIAARRWPTRSLLGRVVVVDVARAIGTESTETGVAGNGPPAIPQSPALIKRVVAEGSRTTRTKLEPVLQPGPAWMERFAPDGEAPKLPDDQLFVLSDNQTAGFDSRSFGPIPRSAVIGVVVPTNAATKSPPSDR